MKTCSLFLLALYTIVELSLPFSIGRNISFSSPYYRQNELTANVSSRTPYAAIAEEPFITQTAVSVQWMSCIDARLQIPSIRHHSKQQVLLKDC